jgi:4-hydroxythreonine-4-phosphate dehydrogenase
MGDPAGVGPEVIAGAWPDARLHDGRELVVLGHPEWLRRAVALRGVEVEVVPVSRLDELASSPGVMPCLTAAAEASLAAPRCEVSALGGQAAFDCIERGIDLALAQQVDGIVTLPLNKAALREAGHHYPGHTELLAERCGVREFAMMLYLGPAPPLLGSAGLGVVHVTLHVALRGVFEQLTSEAVLEKIRLADVNLSAIKGSRAKVGVCALNPHAGELGLFGDEETRIIAPAVAMAQAEGIDVSGPWPTDSLMVQAREGAFDAIVAMYHDQGHIALKLLGMHRAVNITLGLPIVRTSVAHGTAFDLAWQGRAEINSLFEAVRVAAALAAARSTTIQA